MIFHDLKTIFMHVERTGGVSIRTHLLNYETNFERISKTKHLTVKETLKEVGDLWDKYFKFGFVRNPYDRLVSWYHSCNQNLDWVSSIAKHMRKYKSFEEIIYNPHPQILIPQVKKLDGVNFIGRFENYKESMIILCSKLDIPYKDVQKNGSKHKSYRDYYNNKTKNIVTEWYKEDLEKFNYEF